MRATSTNCARLFPPVRNSPATRGVPTGVRIEIWSDIACPWCYIGKRRLEQAVAAFVEHHPEASPGGTDPLEVRWRAFQLDPGAPATPSDASMADHLGGKYGGGAAAGQQMIDRMEAVAAEEGLLYRLAAARRVTTRDAHRLLHAAGLVSATLQDALKERLLAAYLVEGRNVADHDELVAIASEAGLQDGLADEVLRGGLHAQAVADDLDQALAYGVGGVPFTVVDGRFGVSGAQPVEVFTQTLERAWDQAHPSLVMAGETGEVCGPDGCTS